MFDTKSYGVSIPLPFCDGEFLYRFSDDFNIPLTYGDLATFNQTLRSCIYDFIVEKIEAD